ncbi:hypothetical protein [Streptomyces sp. PH10-H1]|nr:hypothetical protein [Streptomyces sp. PH10-H1]MDJ0346416.1 hypothetical protein [Streptomyces sp. PH10-H1]
MTGRQWRRGGTGGRWHTLEEGGALPAPRKCTADVIVDCAVSEDG